MATEYEDVSVDDALRATGGLLRRQPGSLLPYYALVAGTADVTRLPLLVGMVVVTLALASTGQLAPLLDELASVNPAVLDPNSPTGLPPDVGERLAAVVFSPSVAVPLAVSLLTALVVTVLARGVTRAAALSALDAGFSGDSPLTGGVAGMARWKTFAGLVVVRWGLLLVAAVPLVAAVLGGVATFGTVTDPAAMDQEAVVVLLAALVGGALTLGGVVVVIALLVFAGPAAVVDDCDLLGAVRKSVGLPFAHPVEFLMYGVVVVGVYVVVGIAAGLFGFAGVDRLVTVASAFVVSPLLDGVAVALYVGWTGGETDETDETDERVTPEAAVDTSGFVFGQPGADGVDSNEDRREEATVGSAIRTALVHGLCEVGAFVRDSWGYVLVSAMTLLVGITAGWAVTVGSGVRLDTPVDPAGVFGLVPVGPFVNISVNNWFVATTAGFSGLFAGLPTVGTLLFNGLLVGAVAGVVDPVVFLAFVGPHGVIELPVIAVAGGVGLRLGHVTWGVWRGSRSTSALADEMGKAWRLVVGLFVVFVVAGFVEAFVTPQVAAAVL